MRLCNEDTIVALKVHFSSCQLMDLLAHDRCHLIDDWISISYTAIICNLKSNWWCGPFIFNLGIARILIYEELLNVLPQLLVALLSLTNPDSITLENVIARLSIHFFWKFIFVLRKRAIRLHNAICLPRNAIINAFFLKVRQILILQVKLMSFQLLGRLFLRA